jgi:ferredoxin
MPDAATPGEKHGAQVFTVTVAPAGWRFDAPADATLLASALAAGIALPSSCRNGTCRTCLCTLLQGEVRYLIEWPGLSSEEKAAGRILACVALPCGDLVLDAPDARRFDPMPVRLPSRW